jgi:hypothetical protein
MKKAPPATFSEMESKILVTLYEQPGSNLNANTLAQALDPTEDLASPEYQTAVEDICEATENLIVHALVQGTRQRGVDDRIYFGGLKLTRKGEQEAILERRQVARLKNAPKLLEAVEAIRKKRRDDQERRILVDPFSLAVGSAAAKLRTDTLKKKCTR